jgi:hypothetical protein
MTAPSETEQTQSKTRKKYLYRAEFDRDQREEVFLSLLELYKDDTLEGDQLPAMMPWAWIKAPEQHRSHFLCSKDELHRESLET